MRLPFKLSRDCGKTGALITRLRHLGYIMPRDSNKTRGRVAERFIIVVMDVPRGNIE